MAHLLIFGLGYTAKRIKAEVEARGWSVRATGSEGDIDFADRQAVRQAGGMLSWSNSVTNSADARRMLGRWADQLVTFLQSHYSGS